MDMVYLLIALAGGIAVGWYLASRNTAVIKEQQDELIRQEAGAKERVAGLTAQLEQTSTTADKLRSEVLLLNKNVAERDARITPIELALAETRSERDSLKSAKDDLEQKLKGEETRANVLDTRNQLLQQQLDTLQASLEEFKKQAKTEFENLAQRILEDKAKTFSETTEKSLGTLLDPLKEKLQTFEKIVNDKYTDEAKERSSLKGEIERLISLNNKMVSETTSLTQALRGDSKFQGDWGELVLERILEHSGLRENHEYSLQQGHKDDDGDLYKPDVIINLPENKHIIIDSKVSLTAYERYHALGEPALQEQQLKEHIKSIKQHVSELSSKHYAKLKNINSPDFVLMFIPIEPAYILAMKEEPDLSARAWEKRVAIVTSTTLLATLKTVGSIWKIEDRNRNAEQIAAEAAGLYDKFVGFLEDFEKIGKTFESGQRLYGDAFNKLKDGQGNVFRRMEKLRDMGLSTKKLIRPELLE
ncbi:MAG: DNA recombination protein RmuC [Proteobacteria bacterium]|nr:DNA recombination protein RmuC [Pseudomonadota bacterium]